MRRASPSAVVPVTCQPCWNSLSRTCGLRAIWLNKTDSRECRNCHKFDYMDYSNQEPRASKTHQDALTSGKTCIDCHRGIAHKLPPNANEAYQKLVESLATNDNRALTEYLRNASADAKPGAK